MLSSAVSLAAVAASNPIPISAHSNPNWSWAVTGGATATYNVEYTLDNVYDASITPSWFSMPSGNALSANASQFSTGAVRAVRLNCTAYTSGTLTLRVLQGMPAS